MTTDHRLPAETTTLDRLFEVLSSGSRRLILDALRDESPRHVEELAELDRRHHRPPESVRVALHHNHLPRLDEAGLIRWDRDRETVARGPWFEEVRPLIDMFDENPEALPAGWP